MFPPPGGMGLPGSIQWATQQATTTSGLCTQMASRASSRWTHAG